MTSGVAGELPRHLGRLFGAGSAVGLTDAELLEQLRRRRDPAAEAAFEAIVARHGAMVLTVCRRVLLEAHAADDAFQATFLVLVRNVGTLRVRAPGTLGPWLHGVAYRIALKSRQGTARRLARERRAGISAAGRPSEAVECGELNALVHEEVDRLPSKYRSPVVLCYFEGRTHDEASAALGWPVGTVRGRLARARNLLRERLARRGVAPGAWIGQAIFKPMLPVEAPARLLDATVTAAVRGTPGAAVAAMAEVVPGTMFAVRVKMMAFIAGIVLMAAGFALALRGAPAVRGSRDADGATAPIAKAAQRLNPIERAADPLPEHARARLGGTQFHHADDIQNAIYTRDGKSLVAIDARGGIRVWDAATGRVVRTIGERSDRFWQIALAPDGSTLATIGDPGELRIWDLNSGRERRRWHAMPGIHRHLRFSPDGRSLAAGISTFDPATKKEEKFINLWDLTAATERRRRLDGDWLELGGIALAPDGKTLVTGSNDTESRIIGEKPLKGSTRIWDLVAGRERARFPINGFSVHSVAVSGDGSLVAAGVSDRTIRVYELTTGRERLPRIGQDHGVTAGPEGENVDRPSTGNLDPLVMNCLAFSPDGSMLASGACGTGDTGMCALAEVYLWNVARGSELRHFPAHQASVHSLSFSPDGRTLASAGAESAIRLWDAGSGREAFRQPGHRSCIRKLAISPADGTVFTAGQDGTIRRWDPTTGRELDIFAAFAAPIDAIAFAPDGKTLVMGGSFGGLALWSVAERREIHRLVRVEERIPVHHVVFSPDGKTVASECRVWDAASGKVLVAFRNQDGQKDGFANFYPMFYTPDGERIITAESEGVRVWDIASGKEDHWVFRSPRFHFYAVALSPDGRFLARGGLVAPRRGIVDASIRLIDVASGKEVATFTGHEEGTRALAFSPDGRFLASGSGNNNTDRDATVRVWDTGSGRERLRLPGHLAAVNAVAFSDDGRSLVSGSADGTAIVWDVADLRFDERPDRPLAP